MIKLIIVKRRNCDIDDVTSLFFFELGCVLTTQCRFVPL